MKKYIVQCKECNKKFPIPKYRLSTVKYCSRICKNKNNTIKITANCLICKKIFTHISSRANKAKYCSRKCFHKSQIGKGNTEYKCRYCNKIFYDSKSCKRKYCSKKCVNKNNISKYKPGINSIRLYLKNRNLINKCEKCGYDKIKEILGIHHIDRNNKNNDIKNLIILCPNCHSIEHKKHIVH